MMMRKNLGAHVCREGQGHLQINQNKSFTKLLCQFARLLSKVNASFWVGIGQEASCTHCWSLGILHEEHQLLNNLFFCCTRLWFSFGRRLRPLQVPTFLGSMRSLDLSCLLLSQSSTGSLDSLLDGFLMGRFLQGKNAFLF